MPGVGVVIVALGGTAYADDYPNRSITLVVPAPAGGDFYGLGVAVLERGVLYGDLHFLGSSRFVHCLDTTRAAGFRVEVQWEFQLVH